MVLLLPKNHVREREYLNDSVQIALFFNIFERKSIARMSIYKLLLKFNLIITFKSKDLFNGP
jgi:hypothetical protein